MQRGKCGIVQTTRHREARERKSRQQRHDSLRKCEHGKGGGAARRAPGQDRTTAARIDQPADRRRRETRYEETRGEAAEHRDVADPELVADRRGEHGDRIVEASPRDDLRDPERGDYPTKANDRRMRGARAPRRRLTLARRYDFDAGSTPAFCMAPMIMSANAGASCSMLAGSTVFDVALQTSRFVFVSKRVVSTYTMSY